MKDQSAYLDPRYRQVSHLSLAIGTAHGRRSGLRDRSSSVAAAEGRVPSSLSGWYAACRHPGRQAHRNRSLATHHYPEYRDFQEELLTQLLEIDTLRGQCARVRKRLLAGKSVPADTPELRSGWNPTDVESWELEAPGDPPPVVDDGG